MLHHDIYRIIALHSDITTVFNLVNTRCEISDPCECEQFWYDWLEYQELPKIAPTANWAINYQNLYVNITKMKDNISTISKGLIIRDSISYNIFKNYLGEEKNIKKIIDKEIFIENLKFMLTLERNGHIGLYISIISNDEMGTLWGYISLDEAKKLCFLSHYTKTFPIVGETKDIYF